MRNLIDFLIKHHAWMFFILYVVLSCVLLFSSNPYQRSVFFGSSNRVVAQVYEVANVVSGYFGLRKANEELLMQNGELAMENLQLRRQLQRYSYAAATDSLAQDDPMLQQYDFVMARVINNSVSHLENYITLDKGSADGIAPEMAVVDHRGIVGIVNVVNEHNSVAISVLNAKLHVSCKVKGTVCFGSLVWDGRSAAYAVLEEMPRHVEFVQGDTIVTSGFSAVFPDGIMVGTIHDYAKQKDDNFYAMQVKLSTDFTQLGVVRVIRNHMQDQQQLLEKEARQ
ncbi:MAG: rod shape-determining protein MreC [Muribaculaceae bacterium]|nr:rod shape-determining protein MreC [Muribaculaceae bacterium]